MKKKKQILNHRSVIKKWSVLFVYYLVKIEPLINVKENLFRTEWFGHILLVSCEIIIIL